MSWKKNILFNIAFAITCLMAFLLIFEDSIQIPVWLQVFGRTHPLFLHIPIGLLLLLCIAEFLSFGKNNSTGTYLKDGLLQVTAVSLTLTALMGLFLSKEENYDSETFAIHKWAGIAACFIVLAWYQWRYQIRQRSFLNKGFAALGFISIIFTGHQGGNITHGENYVLDPILRNSNLPINIPFDSAIVYDHMVQPILESKCITCHNESRAKGELVMESPEWLIKGGKNGKLWDTTVNNLGLLFRRIHLPIDNKERMPPRGKPQLTESDLIILEQWVKNGSNFTTKVAELKTGDTLKEIAAAMFSKEEDEHLDFEPADESTVKSLNNYYRLITPIAENVPGLNVAFFGASKFNKESLKDLIPVKDKVVYLNLSSMPVKDEQFEDISKFSNLRKLNLSFTKIKGDGLSKLKKLKHLREISISGTGVDTSALLQLMQFTSLRKVFLWSTNISKEQVSALSGTNPEIEIETGFFGDSIVLKLTPPMIQNTHLVASEPVELKLKHNINGAEIRYTLDGTDPDSIVSPLYKGDVIMEKDAVIKTKVFRKGWIASDIQTASFFIGKIKSKSIKLFTQPSPSFRGDGSATLSDNYLTLPGMAVGRWLGFYQFGLDVLMTFEDNTTANQVSISFVTWHDYHAFVPESISLWYGDDTINLRKLKVLHPEAATKKMPIENISFTFNLPAEKFKFLRIKAKPLQKVPYWMDIKQPPGSVFVDEIVIK